MSDAVIVAVIGGACAVAAGIPAAFAAIITSRTSKENAEQHGTSQAKVGELTGAIRGLHHTVHGVDQKLDTVAETVAVHDDHIRRWLSGEPEREED